MSTERRAPWIQTLLRQSAGQGEANQAAGQPPPPPPQVRAAASGLDRQPGSRRGTLGESGSPASGQRRRRRCRRWGGALAPAAASGPGRRPGPTVAAPPLPPVGGCAGLAAVSGPVADPHQPALRLNCRTLPGLEDTGSRAESDGHWPARGTPQVAGVACGPPDHRAAGRQAESDINKWLYY